MTYLWNEDNDWSFDKIQKVDQECAKIAFEELKLGCYPNQIEIISSDQMMDYYTSHGLPLMYTHWSYGKQFVSIHEKYKKGMQGLAYEIIINSNPSIAYLMEGNTMTMQALVIAHASYGHNSFFKNNYLFKYWTDADAIVDYMKFAKNYVTSCEEKYGITAVEEILDSCHSLMNHGIDRYKKPGKLSKKEEIERIVEREKYRQSRIDDLWKTLPPSVHQELVDRKKLFLAEPQENLLYFIEKNAPMLETWQRELVRIVRKMSQYFYPQMQTKVMNEGWACFCHYYIMKRLWEKELITDAAWFEFIDSHTAVVSQPSWDSKYYSGINPYWLGFKMFMDIKRICEDPTDEDIKWFPDIAGSDWLETCTDAMRNYKDESFILQFLSPRLIRDMKLFSLNDDQNTDADYFVSDIHNDDGYNEIKNKLSRQHDISFIIPDIQIVDFDLEGDRTLYLKHFMKNGIPLNENSTTEVLRHVHRLWGFDIILECIHGDATYDTYGIFRDEEKKRKFDEQKIRKNVRDSFAGMF